MPSFPRKTPARWPFWLLIAAWVCANSPQSATYAVIGWLIDARHFSHQQQLTLDVAFALVGQKAPGRIASSPVDPAQFPPAVPAEAVLKRIELAFERVANVPPPEPRSIGRETNEERCPDSMSSPPPHEPPRGRRAV